MHGFLTSIYILLCSYMYLRTILTTQIGVLEGEREEIMNKLAVFLMVSFVLVSSLLTLSQGKAILISLSNFSCVLSSQF
jgi:hypothetical protein